MTRIAVSLGTFAVLAATGAASIGAAENPSLRDRLDRWLTDSDYRGVVLVAKDGEVVLRKGYGLSDREAGTPNGPGTVFTFGSITKPFTAAAILKLESQGKLSFDDPIAQHLPDVPEDKKGITIHHLLTHSSGLASDFAGDYDKVGRDDYVRLALASTLRAEPGAAYHYANSGYSLLGAIVERSSGRPYEAYLREEFDFTPLDVASDLRRETVLTLEEMGIPVEYSHHEVACSQHEIDLRYADALTMADNAMIYRLVVKEIAMKHGVYATFMPKPMFGENGSGMHVHQSLFKGDANAFFDAEDRYHLSPVGRSYLAGLLLHAREITLVTSQWVNSYKRLVPGYEAPVYISWAQRNRSDLIRIPVYKPGKEKATHIELRC